MPDRERPGGFCVRVGGADQSYVDLDDPTYLDFPYVRRIADVIDSVRTTGRMRVVHVGGAGLTLPRYVAVTRPGTAQVVLEPDEALTTQVREALPLPPRSGIKVRAVDGRGGIAAMADDHADVVVVDAFVGAQVPGELVTTAFLADLDRVVRPSGLVALNVPDGAPFGWSSRVVAGLRSTFSTVVVGVESATLKGRRRGNILLVAGDADLRWQDWERVAARQAFPYRVLGPADVASRFAAAAPFTDDDTESSPPPPDGATHFG